MSYDDWKLMTPDYYERKEKEEKEEEDLFCGFTECGDLIDIGTGGFVNGKWYCGYCIEHVLKIKQQRR